MVGCAAIRLSRCAPPPWLARCAHNEASNGVCAVLPRQAGGSRSSNAGKSLPRWRRRAVSRWTTTFSQHASPAPRGRRRAVAAAGTWGRRAGSTQRQRAIVGVAPATRSTRPRHRGRLSREVGASGCEVGATPSGMTDCRPNAADSRPFPIRALHLRGDFQLKHQLRGRPPRSWRGVAILRPARHIRATTHEASSSVVGRGKCSGTAPSCQGRVFTHLKCYRGRYSSLICKCYQGGDGGGWGRDDD